MDQLTSYSIGGPSPVFCFGVPVALAIGHNQGNVQALDLFIPSEMASALGVHVYYLLPDMCGAPRTSAGNRAAQARMSYT